MKRTSTSIRRLILLAALPLLLFVAGGCKDDPNPGDAELTLFLLACPAGPFACYDACFAEADVNQDSQLTGSEFFFFNACSSGCQNRCALAFLFYYLVDDTPVR